jgi:CRISPR-associated protein Cmr6
MSLARQTLRPALQHALNHPAAQPNPGLLLHKGMTQTSQDDKKAKSDFIKALARHSASPLYQRAYQRWERATPDIPGRFANLIATVQGRLYIGTERSNPLETGITTHHSHGLPLIPGSAVKGNCRAHALEIGLQNPYDRWIFGKPFNSESGQDSEDREGVADVGGNIVFHDAWWVPNSGPQGKAAQPFAAEIVTPHHSAYYSSGGATKATDFDSPSPAPQIATHGRFRFLIESLEGGSQAAVGLNIALELLKETLEQQGLGGKGSSGYGYFVVTESNSPSPT